MKLRTRKEIKFKLFWHDQSRVYRSQAPVQPAYQALKGSGTHGKDIFDVE